MWMSGSLLVVIMSGHLESTDQGSGCHVGINCLVNSIFKGPMSLVCVEGKREGGGESVI
jgi:hypothetical protein